MTHLRVWERHDYGRQAKIQGSLRWTEFLVGTGHGGWHRERGGKPPGRAEIALCGALWRLARGICAGGVAGADSAVVAGVA